MALIVFDLDGTLMDSYRGLAVAMNHVLEEMGLPTYPEDAYKKFVGNGIEMLVERALPEGHKDQLDVAFPKMIDHYIKEYEYGLVVYDGIYELLDQLFKEGHQIAMITNKFHHMAKVIMESFFSQYAFKAIIGRSDIYPAKPDPETLLSVVERSGLAKEQCYMVGDTEVDIMTARNAGVQEIFVTWGFRKLHEIEDLVPLNVIDHPRELLDIIKDI